MAGFDTTAASGILKDIYLPPTRDLLDNGTVLLKYLEKEVVPVEGNNFVLSIHTGRNEAAGVGRAEDTDLPTAGKQSYAKPIVPYKRLYSRIRLTGPVIAATKSNKGSFLRALESEMKFLMKDTKNAFNRQLHGDGRDVLGFWVSGTGTSPVVDDGQANPGADFFDPGATTVDFVDSDNSTIHNSAITGTRGAVGATGRTITTSAAVASAAAGDYFIKSGTLGQAMTGLQAVVDNGNPPLLAGGLHSLTVAAQPDWIAVVVGTDSATASGRSDLSFGLIQRLLSELSTTSDTDEGDIDQFLCSYGMRDTYVQLCQNERRFYNNMKLDGGFDAVTYNKKPIVPDKHCRRNRIYAINYDSLAIFRVADLDWMERDGAVLNRVENRDAYEATMYVYQELACKIRNQNGVLKGINEVTS